MKSLSLAKPHLIIMVGLPGSGKTFFAERFAETFHAPYVCEEKIAAVVSGDTVKVADMQLTELLKTNQSIIFEGSTGTRGDRALLAKKARQANYEPLFVWAQVDELTAKTRSNAKGLSDESYAYSAKKFTPPNSIEKPLVISGKHTYASQAKVILKKLSTPRAEISAHANPPLRQNQPQRRSIAIR